MNIDVCIATYRRAAWLGDLLADLAAQRFEGDVAAASPPALRVIVIDNDPARSAEPVVRGFAAPGIELVYGAQPKKNIALTRNAALDLVRGDWVAFVDDDERVPPHWLHTLVQAQRRYDADAVFGPVQGRLPESAPRWLRRGGFFAARQQPSGSVQPWGGTGNAFVRAHWFARGARFDERYGLTGGEDTHLFHALARQGARLVWCQEALIEERVPDERATLRWLMRRYFRGGQSFADVVERPEGTLARVPWALRRLATLAGFALLALLALPFGTARAVRYAGRAVGSAGQLSTLGRHRFQEYR